MKNILVPVDFSAYSSSAAKTGAFLARKIGAQVHILHVVDGPADWGQLSKNEQEQYGEMNSRIAESQRKLEKLAAHAVFKGIDVLTYLRVGVPYAHIISLQKSEQIDLIIMGAHGKGESHSIFIGSTAQRVLRTASVPVLSVKQDFNPSTFRKILFPSNFEENINGAIATVKELAVALKASVELTFINTPGNFVDSETIDERIAKYTPASNGVKFTHSVYNDYDPEKGMEKAASKSKANMIAMVTHNREGKPSYLLGITETLLYHSDVPVLSIVLH